MVRLSEERSREWNGGRYIIRDVWASDDSRPGGERFLRCEYKTRRRDATVWRPTYEGVLFADIEPFEMVG